MIAGSMVGSEASAAARAFASARVRFASSMTAVAASESADASVVWMSGRSLAASGVEPGLVDPGAGGGGASASPL
jgi:hypothetical protein